MANSKTILIVDDKEINRDILDSIFKEKHRTIHAADGLEAMEILRKNGTDIDLVLLDLVMPKLDGFGVLECMRSEKIIDRIPVIIVTASHEMEDELRAYEIGASEFIHKPFVAKVVLRRSENLMELFETRKMMSYQLESRTRDLDQTMKALEEQTRILQERTLELESSKTNDRLTGLMNMEHFLTSADQCLRKADAEDSFRQYAFVYTNIRNFKYFNVKYEMAQGDLLLKSLSSLIRQTSGLELCARFGDDHFVMLTRREDLPNVVELLRNSFEDEFGFTGMKLKVGVYRVLAREEKASTSCELARIACEAIRNAQDFYCEYNEELNHRVEMNAYVTQNLETAFAKGYIQIYYQPVVRTISGAVCGMEALTRWIDPEKGFVSPAEFIPALEESRLITKLDLYVLRKVCEEMKELERQGRTIVPVSFNLSRIDFQNNDIYQEVENIVQEYEIARDMINIEITESTVIQEPEKLRKEIARFRSGGYQVWMDDFGSGYSSLNVLKDFVFDEIKLDMAFLSTFDEKSKKIVKSIVLMAKEIGIQTLAEGVETQEQYDYLRALGCEKVQGYLISRPQPLAALIEQKVLDFEKLENRAWKYYYNQIGGVNFITDRALSIVEFDGENFEYLFVNQRFQEVWNSLGGEDLNEIYRNVNSPTAPISKLLRDFHATFRPEDGRRQLLYSVRGQYIRIIASCLARHNHHAAYDVEIVKMTSHEEDRKREELDSVIRMMFAIFDVIYQLDLTTGKFESIVQSAYQNMEDVKNFYDSQKIDIRAAAELFIHPGDREAYEEFANQDTLVDRLKAEERGIISRYFRTRTRNGSYVWKLHTLLYIKENRSVIYCTRYAPFSQEGLIERIAPEYHTDIEDAAANRYHQILRQGVLASQTLNLFWKDKNRRFLGANDCFLNTYGFRDVSDIIGKTDEDMGWHIDNEPFADDEKRVLENGEVIRNQMGRCIIKGVAHSILATKEPLFENGKIVGMLGFFINADEMHQSLSEADIVRVKDPVTDLMSPQGLINVLSEYAEGWMVREENFAAIRISIQEYKRAARTYGEVVARRILHQIGQMIAQAAGSRSTCARLYAGEFVVLVRNRDKHAADQLSKEICARIDEVHQFEEYPVTLYPKAAIYYADEVKDMHHMIGMASGGTVVDFVEKKKIEE